MGIRDLFKKKSIEPQSKKIDGSWGFDYGNIQLTVGNFTDTGISYNDLLDGITPMKLYTFKMYKNNLDTRTLGKMYEEVAFEIPATWNIQECINNGMLEILLDQTQAAYRSYNDNGRQIDVLGRFDVNSNFTNSAPGIQEFIDTNYVPKLNEQNEKLRIENQKKMQKEKNPGILVNALGRMVDFFDGIKERRLAKKETKLLSAAKERIENQPPKMSREEMGLSSNEIRQFGKDGFRIGNTYDGSVMAVDIIGDPQMLEDGSYLYTAKKQLVGSFNRPSELNFVPNCQFSLPVPPEQFSDFLKNCENLENPYAKSNADALMMLFNQNPLPGRGLYMGGLYFGNDNNLYYHEFQHIQNSIDYINGSNNQINRQESQRTSEYEK